MGHVALGAVQVRHVRGDDRAILAQQAATGLEGVHHRRRAGERLTRSGVVRVEDVQRVAEGVAEAAHGVVGVRADPLEQATPAVGHHVVHPLLHQVEGAPVEVARDLLG